jgi:hypothetical protein
MSAILLPSALSTSMQFPEKDRERQQACLLPIEMSPYCAPTDTVSQVATGRRPPQRN